MAELGGLLPAQLQREFAMSAVNDGSFVEIEREKKKEGP